MLEPVACVHVPNLWGGLLPVLEKSSGLEQERQAGARQPQGMGLGIASGMRPCE